MADCCICLEDKCETRLPCGHSFHQSCILKWFSYKLVCPVCRTPTISQRDKLQALLSTCRKIRDITSRIDGTNLCVMILCGFLAMTSKLPIACYSVAQIVMAHRFGRRLFVQLHGLSSLAEFGFILCVRSADSHIFRIKLFMVIVCVMRMQLFSLCAQLLLQQSVRRRMIVDISLGSA